MTSRKIVVQTTQWSGSPNFRFSKFHKTTMATMLMCGVKIQMPEMIFSGLILSKELGSKNGHISSY